MTENKTREFFSSVQTILSHIVHAILDNHDTVCDVFSYFKKYVHVYLFSIFIFYHLHFSLQNSAENGHSLPSVIECNMFLEGGMLAYLIDAYTEKKTFSLESDSEDKGKIARTVR